MTDATAPWEMDWGKAPADSVGAADKNPWEMDWSGAAPKEEPSMLSDVGRAALVGPAKGVTGLVGFPGDAAALVGGGRDWAIEKVHRAIMRVAGHTPDEIDESVKSFQDAMDLFKPKHDMFPTSEKIRDAIDAKFAPQTVSGLVTGEKPTLFPEAKTTPGKIIQTIGEFAPMALTGGEGIAANLLKGAVAPGVGSELAGNSDYAKGTWLETPARIAGAIAGGLGAHGVQAATGGLKTIGAGRDAAREAATLTGEPAVNSGAISRMAKDVANDQLTPSRAAAQVDALGPEAMMLDMGRQLQGRAEAVATQPGKGQNTVLNAVEGRTGITDFDPATGRYTSAGEGTAGRMQAMMDHEMGAAPDVVKLSKGIGDIIDKHAKPLYNSVMDAHPVVSVPEEIAGRPAVAAAMKDAPTVARNYGEKLESPTQTQTILKGPGYHIADDITEPAKPSLRYWDYVKKSMDQRIRSYYQNGGASELGSADKADLGGLQAARTALVSHLDEVTGGAYKRARDVAANKPQLQDALKDGRDALNTKLLPEEMADTYRNMSIPQQTMYKVGMRREVDRIIDTARNDAAAARNVLNTNQNREKIATMFGEGAARRIEDQIAAETKFQEATNKIAQSSRTGVRQQLVKDTESPSISQPPQANLTGFAVKAVNKLRDLHAAGVLDNTRTGLGAMAATPGRDVPDLVHILAEYNARRAANARPPIAPAAGTLARVLGMNAIQQGAQGDQRRRAQ